MDCYDTDLTYGGKRTECRTTSQCLPHCGNETCLDPFILIERSDSFRFDPTVTYAYRYLFCNVISEPIILQQCFNIFYRTYSDKDSNLRCAFVYQLPSTLPICYGCAVNEQGCVYFDCRNVQTPYGQGGIGSTCDENGKYPLMTYFFLESKDTCNALIVPKAAFYFYW